MNLLLTSFGRDYRTEKPSSGAGNIFYEMPPALFERNTFRLRPDCSAFFLADSVIMDGQSFERLTDSPHPLYADVAHFFTIAKSEGLLQLVDYEAILTQNKRLLDAMLERDMAELDPWVPILDNSKQIWQTLLSDGNRQTSEIIRSAHRTKAPPPLTPAQQMHVLADSAHLQISEGRTENSVRHLLNAMVMRHSLYSPKALLEFKTELSELSNSSVVEQALRTTVSAYLSYVNSNIVLSHHLSAGVSDWADFTPFYNDKFLRVGEHSRAHEPASRGLNRLFSLLFPAVPFDNPKMIVKHIRDRRLIDLRSLCNDAANGDTVFDDEFAKRVLTEVFNIERNVSRVRNRISWLTLPLGFVPVLGNFIQKPVEELIALPFEKGIRKPYNWFFLINDYADEVRESSANT